MPRESAAEVVRLDNPLEGFPEFLLSHGRLTEVTFDRATRSAAETQEPLVPILCKLGLLSERDMVSELSAYYRVPIASERDFPNVPIYAEAINRRFLLHYRVLPLREEGDALVLAMVDPGDEAAARALAFFSDRRIVRVVAPLTDIEVAIERLYGSAEGTENLPQEAADVSEDVIQLGDLASDAPVIRLVHGWIAEAVESGASDIHIEPFDDRVRVRLRVDGLLREVATEPKPLAMPIASRVKIMAHLDMAERRLPQDGRIRFAVRGKSVDIRVSVSPTVHGESIALRILDRSNVTLDFRSLGFDEEIQRPVEKLLQRPHGIILVTGPTGSGKTTTLYAALQTLNTPERKILTIEDPVEFQLDGINQQAVQPDIGRTFAGALRSFLRQDPDIILVGEIRDGETAQIAVQAALTGHLILSTLHTNNAASAMTRLLDMGVEDYLLTSTIAGVLSQRLVRCLCKACREPYEPEPELLTSLGLQLRGDQVPTFNRPHGCEGCHESGYRGRIAIIELLEVDDSIRRMVLRKADAQEIQQAAAAKGMRTMYQHGLGRVLAGETSLEEVLRVTREA